MAHSRYRYDVSSTTLAERRNAIVRGIPSSFTDALTGHFGNGPTDIGLARAQHAAYVQALREHGVNVIEIEPDEAHPDCVFVEDQAVTVGKKCFIPLVGHKSRIGEQAAVISTLAEYQDIIHMEGGMMDGGDVMRIGDIFFVGHSERTDDDGIAEFRNFIEGEGFELRVVVIPKHVLHLTSMCSAPRDDILLLTEGTVSPTAFGELPDTEIIMVPEVEVKGANTIGFGDRIIIAAGNPTIKSELESRGISLTILDIDQISAADASLTCCSVFFP